MQKLMLTAAALSLFAVTATVHADDDSSQTPFYIGADIGHVSVDHGSISFNGGQGGYINGTGTAESFLGGYFFTDNFGLELGYHDYGSPTAYMQSGIFDRCPDSFSCPKVTAVTAEVLGSLEVAPQLDGILRLGLQDWNVGSPGETLLSKTSGEAFIYGVGIRRHFDYGVSVDVTYERSSFTTEETRIGVSYSF
jgi:opacity protein-like surface antigen